ncbi:hypothetical protein JOC83_000475 [Bacillus iocasae]|uniref:Uncharacterized protein n=1 Tax=Priestia iocasae TaxID=2291674 RepID=A0ABS2QQB8_9BACI|nr:hypothetical protein [Metabacillus iocasae]
MVAATINVLSKWGVEYIEGSNSRFYPLLSSRERIG